MTIVLFIACSLVLVVCVIAGVAAWRVVGEAARDTRGYWTQDMLDRKRWLASFRPPRMIEYEGLGYRGRVATVTQSGRWITSRLNEQWAAQQRANQPEPSGQYLRYPEHEQRVRDAASLPPTKDSDTRNSEG